MKLNLAALKTGDPVRYRHAHRDNADGTAPEWSEWKTGTLFVQRREKKLRSHPEGEILTLGVNELMRAGWAEYGEDDYEPDGNEWLCENYRLEFEPISEPEQSRPSADANWREMVKNNARPGDVANLILERDALLKTNASLRDTCTNVRNEIQHWMHESPPTLELMDGCVQELNRAISKAL